MDALSIEPMTEEQNDRISAAIAGEQSRLRNFIRKQVVDESDAEDILQEVFYELVQAYRLMRPVEQVGAWLFRVARNRITDRFRKRRAEPLRGQHNNGGGGWRAAFLGRPSPFARCRSGGGLRA